MVKAKHLPDQSNRRAYLKLPLLTIAVLISIAGAIWGKTLYDTYHDRPLSAEFQYVGRDYHSGCVLFDSMCFGPTTEYFYYATDTNPKDIVKVLHWVEDYGDPDYR